MGDEELVKDTYSVINIDQGKDSAKRIVLELCRARESEKRLVEALTKAADSFRDAAMMAAILGRPVMAEAMKIAEKDTREAISAAGVKT